MASKTDSLKKVLAELVAFDTVSCNSNLDCAQFVAGLLSDAGVPNKLDIETVDGVEKANVIGLVGPDVDGGLFVSGHLDVVPFEGQPGWSGNPLELRTDGERVVGRGVADMKGFVASVLHGLRSVDLTRLERPLVLAFTCDEEVGCAGSGRLVDRLPALLDGCPLPDYGWIGEPTDFRTMVAHKGYFQCDITVNSPGGHSSRPDLGVNSIVVMSEIVTELSRLGEEWREATAATPDLFDGAGTNSLNVAHVSGGLAMNMIPEECRLRVSGRSLPGADQSDLVRQLEEATRVAKKRVVGEREDVSLRVENVEMTPAMGSPEESELVSVLCEYSDKPAGRAPYATDGGNFAQLGIQSYICGPGEIAQAHQPDESVPLEDLTAASAMFTDVCQRYLSD